MRAISAILAVMALASFVGFTPARVRLSATVEVTGTADAAVSAIAAEIVAHGGTLITSPSKQQWYLIEGISVSLIAGERSVIVEASRFRGPGCDTKSHDQDWNKISTAINELIDKSSAKSGIPMRYTPKKEPNELLKPTPTSRGGSS